MRFSAANCWALLALGALMDPSAIYAETVSVTPHTTCSSVAIIDVAKPRIHGFEVAPIPVARAEIASVEVAGKEKGGADASKQEVVAEQPSTGQPCPSPSPIGVRYVPDIQREIAADYERKRPRDPTFDSLKQAASKVEIQIWRLGVSKTGGAFLSAFISNQNDFALQQVTLRCEFVTKDGPKVFFYKISEVIEPSSLGPATINYVDHPIGAAPADARDANCTPDEVGVWYPGEDIQSRR